MSNVKAKMHQIRFRLGLHLIMLCEIQWDMVLAYIRIWQMWLRCKLPQWGWGSTVESSPLGELTALPQTPYLHLRGLLLRERRGREGRGKGGKRWGCHLFVASGHHRLSYATECHADDGNDVVNK